MLGSKSRPPASCREGSWESSGIRRVSVTVLEEECEEGVGRSVGEVGLARASSSGLAIRRPPRLCDKDRSPFIVAAATVGYHSWWYRASDRPERHWVGASVSAERWDVSQVWSCLNNSRSPVPVQCSSSHSCSQYVSTYWRITCSKCSRH